MAQFILFINRILVFELIYFLVCYIIFVISMWKIFKKENISKYYSLIPFYNIYIYYKICKLPFWSFFIPLINVIVFYCSFYVITKQYRCKRWMCILAIFFPYILLPYIAFSDKKNINFKYDNVYLRNNDDVNKLEDKLTFYSQGDDIGSDFKEENEYIPVNDSDTEMPLENDLIIDEYVYNDFDDTLEQDDKNKITDDIIELDQDIEIEDLSISNFEKYEKNLDISSSVEKRIDTDIKDYKGFEVSNESIAFGGEGRKEEIYEIEAKNDELKCKRCGSSLVGAVNNVCPGCGAPVEKTN